jgi:hypothetical protein
MVGPGSRRRVIPPPHRLRRIALRATKKMLRQTKESSTLQDPWQEK